MRLGKEQAAGYVADVEPGVTEEIAVPASAVPATAAPATTVPAEPVAAEPLPVAR
jgi:hypothetical protein